MQQWNGVGALWRCILVSRSGSSPLAAPINGVFSVVVAKLTVNQQARVRFPKAPQTIYAPVAQLVEATVLEAVQCGFESLPGHQRI